MAGSRVNEIDFLRFLTAISVAMFHYTFRGNAADSMSVMPYPLLAPVTMYGYFTGGMLFMISGFAVLMSASSGNLRRFVVSRMIRLYPAFWVCCTITFVTTLMIGAPYYHASLGQYLVNMTMLSGFVGVASIDGVYWTLFYELSFYGLTALVLLFGGIRRSQALLAFWLLAAVVLQLFPSARVLWDFFLVKYAVYFIGGALCYLIWREGASRARLGLLAAALALALYQSVGLVAGFERHYGVAVNGYVVAGIVTAMFGLLLLVALRLTGGFGRVQWTRLGALTYPLYLIHQNVGYMIFNLAYPRYNVHVVLWGTLAAMLLLSYAIHVGVEKRLALPLKDGINVLLDTLHDFRLRLVGASLRGS